MTTSMDDVRTSLAAAVLTTGLRSYAYIQDQINDPCSMVIPLDYDPRLVLGNSKSVYPFQVRCYFPRASAVEQMQKLMDQYRMMTGSLSIRLAIETSTNWSAAVDYATVTRIGEVTATDAHLIFEIDVEVCW